MSGPVDGPMAGPVTVAFLGGGLIGRPMAERLAEAGHTVWLYNRTGAKVAGLAQRGIHLAGEAAAAIRPAEAVILMLADAEAIRQVLLAPAARQALSGKTVIQMGTIGPEESCELEREVVAAGGDYLEAPVLGSIAEAKARRLLVMAGGKAELFARWRGLLGDFGPEPRLIGPVGKAAAVKLALNQLIAAEITALSLSVGLIEREGIDVETFMAVLKPSALFAPAFEKKLPRLLQRDYANPNFSTRHLLKDVDLFVRAASARGLNTDALSGPRRLLAQTVARGLAEVDYSAVYEGVNPRT